MADYKKYSTSDYKKWSINILSLTSLVVVLLIVVNFAVDPLQFYRKAFYSPDFNDQQRYQNPGLAKNYDYDTIVIGSSMSENLLPSYINQKLGVKTIKLSISGSSAKEQYLIADMALNTGKVKNVFWVVDYFSMRGDPERVRDEYGPFPFYLYDNNILNDVNYLLNFDTTKQVLHLLAVKAGLSKRNNPDLNKLNTWGNPDNFGKEKVLKEWEKYMQGGSVEANEYEFINIQTNIDKNMLPLVKKYPNVTFYFYYPPYSILQHRLYYEKNPVLFENELKMKRYIFDKTVKCPNVKIFDFQHEKSITFDLNNYKDLAHHSPRISLWIIDCMAKDKYLVNKNNLDSFLKDLKTQVETVNLKELHG